MFRALAIISNSMITSRFHGAELLEARQYVWMWVDSDSGPREPACFVEKASQSVSQLRAAALLLMSAARTACRHMHQQLGGARPALRPPEPAGSYQPWQLCTALTTCVTSCGFPLASRRGTIPLLRARIGHSHLDLNVGGCVAFRICSLLKLTLRSDQNSQMTY